jgi:hypothetical protein
MSSSDQRELTIFLPYEAELAGSGSARTAASDEFEIVIEVRRNRVEWVMRALPRATQAPPADAPLAHGIVDAVCVQWVADDGFVRRMWRHSSLRPGPPDSSSSGPATQR